jgi:hypothetical protein
MRIFGFINRNPKSDSKLLFFRQKKVWVPALLIVVGLIGGGIYYQRTASSKPQPHDAAISPCSPADLET